MVSSKQSHNSPANGRIPDADVAAGSAPATHLGPGADCSAGVRPCCAAEAAAAAEAGGSASLPQQQPVRLNSLRKGQCARLEAAMLPCGECDLLEALGLERQCELEVCKAGDPCIVRVRSTRIGLSARVARELLVMPTVSGAGERRRLA